MARVYDARSLVDNEHHIIIILSRIRYGHGVTIPLYLVRGKKRTRDLVRRRRPQGQETGHCVEATPLFVSQCVHHLSPRDQNSARYWSRSLFFSQRLRCSVHLRSVKRRAFFKVRDCDSSWLLLFVSSRLRRNVAHT